MSAEPNDIATQLTGRAAFLRDRREVKSPDLMERAALEMATMRTALERIAYPLVDVADTQYAEGYNAGLDEAAVIAREGLGVLNG